MNSFESWPSENSEKISKKEEIPQERVESSSEQEKNAERFLEISREKEGLVLQSRIERVRLQTRDPEVKAEIGEEDEKLVEQTVKFADECLNECYSPRLGVFPSADPEDNFYDQVWARDLAHAGGNFFADENSKALETSLTTIFNHQRDDGAIPFRVERKHHIRQLFPGMKALKKIGLDFITRKNERAAYEGDDFCNAEDTVPATMVATGEFFIRSPQGKAFVERNFNKMKQAIAFQDQKTDSHDGLLETKTLNPDWADSLHRGGKLGTINVWWARALRMMSFMANGIGREEEAEQYRNQFHRVKTSIVEKLYDKDDHYFRASAGENRLDTVASVFGSLYLLDAVEAARVQETLKKHVKKESGLQNFYPPYPKGKVFFAHRLINLDGYHNEYVWPWVTAQNIQVKVKIAREHPDEKVRAQYKQEAVDDLSDLANLFKDAGGAYEIFEPDTRRPVQKALYKAPKNLMGNLAAYHGAHAQLKKLGWI